MTSSQEMETYETPGAQTNARYLGGWYFCWLIERRDTPQREWLGDFDWVTDANDAVWYARESDAEKVAGNLTYDGRVVVCEHGFMLDQSTTALQSSYDSLARELEQSRKALIKAVEIIKVWHNCDEVWDIYFQASPEMAPVRAALKPSNEVGT